MPRATSKDSSKSAWGLNRSIFASKEDCQAAVAAVVVGSWPKQDLVRYEWEAWLTKLPGATGVVMEALKREWHANSEGKFRDGIERVQRKILQVCRVPFEYEWDIATNQDAFGEVVSATRNGRMWIDKALEPKTRRQWGQWLASMAALNRHLTEVDKARLVDEAMPGYEELRVIMGSKGGASDVEFAAAMDVANKTKHGWLVTLAVRRCPNEGRVVEFSNVVRRRVGAGEWDEGEAVDVAKWMRRKGIAFRQGARWALRVSELQCMCGHKEYEHRANSGCQGPHNKAGLVDCKCTVAPKDIVALVCREEVS